MTERDEDHVSQPEDDRWIAHFREGDSAAFDCLVRKHAGWATRFAVRLLGSVEAGEDAVQESFVRVYRSLDRFRGESTFRTYLYRVLLNCCRDMGARARREESVMAELHERRSARRHGSALESTHPGHDLSRREFLDSVDRHIDSLPPAQRETLVLRVHENMSYREIGDLLGVSVNAVKGNLAAARARLATTVLGREAAVRNRTCENER